MNKEMISVLLYMLYSEDLKKQSTNVIQQLRGAGGIADFTNDFLSVFSGIEELKTESEHLLANQKADTLDIKASIENMMIENVQFREAQVLSLQQIKESVEEIKIHSDPKAFADNLFASMKEINGSGIEKTQEFFDKQIKAANDISASVSELHIKISALDTLTEKIADLERLVQAQKKLR